MIGVQLGDSAVLGGTQRRPSCRVCRCGVWVVCLHPPRTTRQRTYVYSRRRVERLFFGIHSEADEIALTGGVAA